MLTSCYDIEIFKIATIVYEHNSARGSRSTVQWRIQVGGHRGLSPEIFAFNLEFHHCIL